MSVLAITGRPPSAQKIAAILSMARAGSDALAISAAVKLRPERVVAVMNAGGDIGGGGGQTAVDIRRNTVTTPTPSASQRRRSTPHMGTKTRVTDDNTWSVRDIADHEDAAHEAAGGGLNDPGNLPLCATAPNSKTPVKSRAASGHTSDETQSGPSAGQTLPVHDGCGDEHSPHAIHLDDSVPAKPSARKGGGGRVLSRLEIHPSGDSTFNPSSTASADGGGGVEQDLVGAHPVAFDAALSSATDTSDGGGDVGQPAHDIQRCDANVTNLCAQLRELQAHRVATIRAMNAHSNASLALVRRACGFSTHDDEKSRAAAVKRSTAIVKAIESGKESDLTPTDQIVANTTRLYVLAMQEARGPMETYRKGVEKAMTNAARQLPAHAFVDRVKGFGTLGLAIIVGEAGDLSNYSNPGKLWKRLGLAVIDGAKQGKRTDPAEAERHGYNPRRRSAIWTLADSLLRTNDGEYKAAYVARKEYEMQRAEQEGLVMTRMHAHRRAARYAEKRLVRDLWVAWRNAGSIPAGGDEHSVVGIQRNHFSPTAPIPV